jgi:hypothetical protein
MDTALYAPWSNYLTVEEQVGTIMFEELLSFIFSGKFSPRLTPIWLQEKALHCSIGVIWFDTTLAKNKFNFGTSEMFRFQNHTFSGPTTPWMTGALSYK